MPPRSATDATVRDYASRGRECAYGNLRLVTRVIGSLYDEALRDVGLHAAQLQLLWAIVAVEPVELGELASVTHTDPTTLSRTVEKLRKARLVDVRAGTADARRKEVRMTALGRQRFAAAMPRWEAAQQGGGTAPARRRPRARAPGPPRREERVVTVPCRVLRRPAALRRAPIAAPSAAASVRRVGDQAIFVARRSQDGRLHAVVS